MDMGGLQRLLGFGSERFNCLGVAGCIDSIDPFPQGPKRSGYLVVFTEVQAGLPDEWSTPAYVKILWV